MLILYSYSEFYIIEVPLFLNNHAFNLIVRRWYFWQIDGPLCETSFAEQIGLCYRQAHWAVQ